VKSDATAGRDGFLDLEGLRFHYREWGDSTSSPVVLLHGYGLFARVYDRIAQGLSATRRVLVLDQRGHGESDWASDYAWRRWVEDVEGFADGLDLSSFDLVGHSWGGAVAARFAGLHPHRVQHLVLLETGHVDMVVSPEWPEFMSRVAELNRPDGYGTQEEFVTTMMSLWPRAETSLVEARAAMMVQDESGRFRTPWNTDPSITSAPPTEAEEKDLRRNVNRPTLIAQGEYSEFHVPEANRRLAADFPNGEAATIRGVGHSLAFEQANTTVRLINGFLATSQPATRP
jgi:pimeloyl-ACP methyl ester carboxylesterase